MAAFKPMEIDSYSRSLLEDKFFDTPFVMSYSGLNKLLYSPALFYNHYVLGERDDNVEKHMLEGKLIHCLLLNPEDFDKEFVVSPENLPSDNPIKVLNLLHQHYKMLRQHDPAASVSLEDYTDHLLEYLKEMNLYQSLKTDAQRLDKMLDSRNQEYWNYLLKAEGRSVIDSIVYDQSKSIVDKFKSNGALMKLMGQFGDSMNPIECYNEIELAMMTEYNFGIRGFVDNLVIDHGNKVIRINDLKKSSKDIGSFTQSIEFYRYWIQASMYHKLVSHVYLSKPEYAGYSLEFRFIVIDQYLQMAPIKVSSETMSTWIENTERELRKADYHFVTKNFDLPYAFLEHNEMEL